MTAILKRTSALSDTVADSQFLVRWMGEPDLGTLEQVEPAFESLADAIEALSPTVVDMSLMCYLRNQVASSHGLFNAGEWGAAGYQLRQVHSKLHRALAEAA